MYRSTSVRCRRWCRLPWILVWIAVGNFAILIYFIVMQRNLPTSKFHIEKKHIVETGLQNHVTFVFREFEEFENNVVESVKSLQSLVRDARIVIICDSLPYPPLKLPDGVKLVSMETLPTQTLQESRPENYLNTKYSILLPDSVHLIGVKGLARVVRHLEEQASSVRASVWPTDAHAHLHCTGLTVHLKQWTAKYFPTRDKICDSVTGSKFITVIRTSDLLELAAPFQRPLPQMLFLQTAMREWKIAIGNHSIFQDSRALFDDAHLSWKHRTRHFSRIKDSYKRFGIKLVEREDGQEEWYGCTKESSRCFGTVLHEMPAYLYQQRWTPPCCLRALRITARHVLRVLDMHGVRYWLEGGSLLGAARTGDIIPWDYDVDIGIYMADINKSFYLSSAQSGSYEDEDGYVWEKATEGEFYRVQYSHSNHLHVDIFPFYPEKGNMTKTTWFKNHKQDMPFPEKYLQPMEKLKFVGSEVSVPNHYKEFLELKFGKGVIENPRYPNESPPV